MAPPRTRRTRRTRRPELVLVGVCSGWGTIPLLVRQVDLPAAAIVFARLGIATLGLSAALLLDRGDRHRPRLFSYRPVLCVTVAAILAAHWLSLFAAYQRAATGTVILIVYLAPVGIAALAPTTLGERHSRRTLVALALGVGGAVCVTAPAIHRSSRAGLALAAFAAVSFVALVLASKPLAEAYGGLRVALIEMGGATVCLIPAAATARWGSPQPAWLWLVVLGLVHTALGTGIYLDVLGRVPATSVGIIGYLEPAAVVVLGWLFLHENPAPATLVGGVLIVAAGWLTVTARPVPPLEVALEVPGSAPR